MDPKTSKYLHHLPEGVGARKENPFDDSFPDSLVKLFPMANKSNVVEAPPTPGRPVFSFSIGSRKNFPSKWDDAQKWVIGGPDSPAHHHLHGFVKSPDFVPKHCSNGGGSGFVVKQQQHQEKNQHKTEVFSGVTEEKLSKATSVSMDLLDHQHHTSNRPFNGVSPSEPSDVLLKDKFTNEEEDNFSRFKCLVPIKQGFLFSSMKDASTEVVQEVKQRDSGTNVTPLESSIASRCLTPFKSVSPPRHNTPASMSGPLTLMNASSSFDIAELQECHLAKLQLESPFDSVTCNWSSREEEEEDVSKSLRHFEMNNESPKSIPGPAPGPRACAWEEEESTTSHLRYQREEAKIQAWVNLQTAKAEAQSRKLEVKIQKMRSKFEEKMIKRMASVHRKAEELRVAAQYEHNMQLQKSTNRSKKSKDLHESMPFSRRVGSCSCFPCNTLHS